jgi:hypothetical protein
MRGRRCARLNQTIEIAAREQCIEIESCSIVEHGKRLPAGADALRPGGTQGRG